MSRDPYGPRDYSSPQIRVRGADEFRRYSSERLLLPSERRPLNAGLKRSIGTLTAIAILIGIGFAVYIGVSELLTEETSVTDVAPVDQSGQQATDSTTTVESAASESTAETTASAPEGSARSANQSTETAAADAGQQAGTDDAQPAAASPGDAVEQAAQEQPSAAQQQPQSTAMAISEITPTVAVQPVTAAQLDGAEIVAERVTAEPAPSGIPRTLADGAAYDPAEPATVFTSRWPVGTTLRLTRLPGATLLTDEQAAEVIGTELLVVVRGDESSNTDLQMSPAAFDRIAFYGIERIVAVSVEVTAGAP